MKKLKIFIFGVLLSATHMASFAVSYNAITVTKTDGSVDLIQINDQLSISFENSSLKINSPSVNIEYIMGEVTGYTFDTQKFAGIGNCETDTSATLSINGRNITANCPSQLRVAVYSSSGILLIESMSGTSLDLSELKTGTYIITVGIKSFKIALK
ncbi:hypothetical protein [uncultured Muribaculum sp.]|uniref:hypothetical protein n=1 Tax=uncultured Muribaculum sp. TaxID=1918613 RepID=UPI0025B7A154|nr:hypothetical protein [uncultured Muribaculum sp.]